MELRSQECGNVQLTAHTDSVLERKPLNQPIINEKMKVKVSPTAPKVESQLKEVHQPLLPITNNLKATIKPTTTKVPKLKPQKQLCSPKLFPCNFCKKQYTHRSALFKHLKNIHPTKSASKISGLVKCHEEMALSLADTSVN